MRFLDKRNEPTAISKDFKTLTEDFETIDLLTGERQTVSRTINIGTTKKEMRYSTTTYYTFNETYPIKYKYGFKILKDVEIH